jgi:hypothetical protein
MSFSAMERVRGANKLRQSIFVSTWLLRPRRNKIKFLKFISVKIKQYSVDMWHGVQKYSGVCTQHT